MLFDGRQYYLTAIVIIIIAVAAFMMSFEKRKPQARETALLAVMISLAVTGRIVFFMTPQFKPSAAIIIITGIMLGREAGFLSGAITAFISDFFFGQGPWTPWQMVAFGIIGFVSSILFSKKNQRTCNRGILCVYGFLMTFIVYGVIMDTATVFMYTDSPTLSAFAATYLSGLVFNGIHGMSTAVFLWLLSKPLMGKIQRIKTKYGMYGN